MDISATWNSAVESVNSAVQSGLDNAVTGAINEGAASVNRAFQKPTPTAAAPGAPLSSPNVNTDVDATPWGRYALIAVALIATAYIVVKVVK